MDPTDTGPYWGDFGPGGLLLSGGGHEPLANMGRP
jgi:hypothetical protein